MTEHAQVELIGAIVLIAMNVIAVWRSEVLNKTAAVERTRNIEIAEEARKDAVTAAERAGVAAHNSAEAARNAKSANETAVVLGAKHAKDIADVHDAVNGGMAAQKREISTLKDEVLFLKDETIRLKALLAAKVDPDVFVRPSSTISERLEEIRGES